MLIFSDDVVQLESSERSQTDTPGSSFSQELKKPGPSNPKRSRGSIQIIDEKLVATLDKCMVSDRDALRIIIATLEAVGIDVSTLVLSKTSIWNSRQKLRELLADKIKELFTAKELRAAVLHWDGKLLTSLTSEEKVDRLAIVVSSGDCEKILSIPAIENGTGLMQASAINEVRKGTFKLIQYNK